MASDFVIKVKGIRNIDILSPNITTENDLISTIDGEVYVATNKGYRKITGGETDNNTTEIDLLKNKIKEIETNINFLNEYNKVNTLRDIDLMDINSLNNVPLGVNYVLNSFNKPEEMKDDTGWLTVHSNNSIKRLMFQPYNEARVYYNRIFNDSLGVWE